MTESNHAGPADAETDASANAKSGDPAGDARRWLIENSVATLGTISVDSRCPGYPFCSIVPFALDASGRPLVQIASIAAHTKNIVADPRASLFVHEQSTAESGRNDPQAGWRITLVGKMAKLSGEEAPEGMARLLERVRAARAYEKTHDFDVWRLDVEQVRYIGGFGKICWIDGKDLVREPHGAGLKEAAPGAIAHMNADHGSSMVDMCDGIYGFRPERAEMVALDRAGFLVKTQGPERLVHFSFGKEIDAAALRTAVVDVVKRARAHAKAVV